MRIFLLGLFICYFSSISSGQTYEQCVQLVRDNKYKEATEGLVKLQSVPAQKKDASLLLCIIEADQEKYISAFDDFSIFCKYCDTPGPYFYALVHSGMFDVSRSLHGNEVKSFLKQLINDRATDESVRLKAIDCLGADLSKTGEFAAQRKLYVDIGDVKNWSSVGEFENVSGSGFDKDADVLAHPMADYVFTNKNGAAVKWFDLNTIRNDRWVDFQYHYKITNSTIYAQTFIDVAQDKEMIIKVGVSGSFKIWVNDYLVGKETEERNTNADVYSYKINLKKGVNRVLMQTGSSEISENNFLVRLFDVDGKLFTDISSTPTYKPYTKASPYTVTELPFSCEQYFEQQLQKNKQDFATKVLLLDVYLRNEKKYSAHKILADLKKGAEHSTLVAQLAISTANLDNDKLASSQEIESIKANDPESLIGLIYRLYEAFGKEKWSEAMDIINKRVQLYGESAITEAEKIEVLLKQQENEKVITEVDNAYKKYPSSFDLLSYKYRFILNGSKNIAAANNLLLEYAKTNFNVKVQEQTIENEYKIGDRMLGTKIFNNLVESRPYDYQLFSAFASDLYGVHENTSALQMIDKAIEIAPYMGELYYVKAVIYEAMGQNSDAIAMLRKTISYSPSSYTARKKLAELVGGKDIESSFRKNDVADIYKKGRENALYNNEDIVCLLNDKRQIIYPGHGASVEENEQLFLARSVASIEHLKEYEISYNSFNQRLLVEKAEVLKKDGSIVKAETNEGKCVFSSVEVGDAVHLLYRLENFYEGAIAEHFWEHFYFNNVYPVGTARYSLIVPADKNFNYKSLNGAVQPEISSIDSYKLYVWEANNIPKVSVEISMSADVQQQVIVSSLPGWAYVDHWYTDISSNKIKADFEVKEKVKELMAGHERSTDIEKAKIIYSYIENNFHYSSVSFLHTAFTPQTASRTMSSKLGDCKDLATLFVSMAKEAGLNANLVLVHTKGEDENEFELPTIDFNHCIAHLHIGSNEYFIELTNNTLPFSALGPQLLNAVGLNIDCSNDFHGPADTIIHLNTDVRPRNIGLRRSDMSFTNTDVALHRSVTKVGADASYIREAYREGSEEEREKKLKEDINKEFNKTVKMQFIHFPNLNTLDDSLKLDYLFTIPGFVSEIAGMQVFKFPWTENFSLAQLFSLEKRTYDMNLFILANEPVNSETMTVTLPKGKHLIEQPKDVSLECSLLKYSLQYKITGEKLTATRSITFLKDKVKPAEYDAVKSIIAHISDADSKQFAFK